MSIGRTPEPTVPAGSAPIIDGNGRPISTLLEFWRWSSSNLLDNTLRGVLAEYLVGLALGCTGGQHRTEWDAYDLITAEGIKVEVKSSAYLQSWTQTRESVIQFGIAERVGWNARTNTYVDSATRGADVYVFCLFHERDPLRADPLDTRQWTFLVASTSDLNSAVGGQKSIRLGPLRARVRHVEIGYPDLADSVRRAAAA